MSDVIFRTQAADTNPTPVSETVDKPDSIVIGVTAKSHDRSLDTWKSEHDNAPFTSEYFSLDTPYDYLPSDVQDKLSTIERYAVSELEKTHNNPSTTVMSKFLSDLETRMFMEEDLSQSEKLDRLYGYATNMLKVQGIDEVRERIAKALTRYKSSKAMSEFVLREIGRLII